MSKHYLHGYDTIIFSIFVHNFLMIVDFQYLIMTNKRLGCIMKALVSSSQKHNFKFFLRQVQVQIPF